MSLWCDEKYLRLLSPQLDRFQKRGPRLFNCRCPFCGDSTTSKLKARGYFFPKQQTLIYKCHNCQVALPFGAVLRRLSRSLYDEYVLESFGQTAAPAEVSVPLEVLRPSRVLTSAAFPHVHQLSSASLPESLQSVRSYVERRSLPPSALPRLYATLHAHTWLTPLVGADVCANIQDGIPYLIIPLRVASGAWYGAQLRTLNHKAYLTFRWAHHELNRTFGLDVWNPSELTYCVEGPLDALCIPNALAFCGADLSSGVESLRAAGFVLDNYAYIWDNEPHSSHITRLMRDAIERQERVIVWPKGYPKDVNDCYAAGMDIPELLAQRTYQGLRALLEYQQWMSR